MSKLIHNANDTRKRIREVDNDDDIKVKKSTKKTTKDIDIDTTTTTKKINKTKTTNDADVNTITTTKSLRSKTTTTTTKKVAKGRNTKNTIITTTTKSKSLLKSNEESNIIYLGHVPNGFDEKAMKQYFKQFGDVKKVKLFRSMKTNRSKGYAFVQFVDHEVATIVADAMDGYMMYEKQLVCHVVPKEKCHTGMFQKPKQSKSINDNNDDDDDNDDNEE